jgi:glycosyltransferase involved in cell wall biosynthesis
MRTFSVVMPLYNKVGYVIDAAKSVLAQDFTDFELIVVDDGSTDGGVESLVNLNDPRLKVVSQSNAGVSAARNKGITHANGTYIAFLDADDLWSAEHLVRIAALIDSDPAAVAWATGYSEFDRNCTTPENADQATQPSVMASGSYDHYQFLMAWARSPFFWTGSIAIRAATLQALQPCFPVDERMGEDQDLWFRLSEQGSIRYSNITRTAFYRRGVANSLTSSDILAPLPSMLRLRERNFLQCSPTASAARRLVEVHMLHIAWSNCVAGQRLAALRILWRSDPTIYPTYWLRILAGLLLPSALLRSALTRIKSGKVRKTDDL